MKKVKLYKKTAGTISVSFADQVLILKRNQSIEMIVPDSTPINPLPAKFGVSLSVQKIQPPKVASVTEIVKKKPELVEEKLESVEKKLVYETELDSPETDDEQKPKKKPSKKKVKNKEKKDNKTTA